MVKETFSFGVEIAKAYTTGEYDAAKII